VEKTIRYILTIKCPDQIGIVAAVSSLLAGCLANIVESHQYSDTDSNCFFMRVVFDMPPTSASALNREISSLEVRFAMECRLYDLRQKPRTMILVSKAEHCLNDLLYRHRTGALDMEVTAIVSNHPTLAYLADWHHIPYYYLTVTSQTKTAQEQRILDLVKETNTELVVLARYMQILSDTLCQALAGRAINIHHSFLPGFKGAKPYYQAHIRGVKLIGATAHYVTPHLDEGPIIEQEVERVDHTHSVDQLTAVGRDIENIVLARAVRFHLERRVFIDGNKTVVFR
jgi:formyltetrahydrofolate deformylase